MNGNSVPAPVANSASRQVQARAQGTGSEFNIYEDSDEFPSTADPASLRRGQVDSDNFGHSSNHPPQTSPVLPGPENGQSSVSPFSYLRIGFPRELYRPPPPPPPWSPIILPEPFNGENSPVPQRRRSVHGGFDVPDADHRTYSDGSDSEFGREDDLTGLIDFRSVNRNYASIGGARNEMSLSPFSRSYRDLVGRRWEMNPHSQAGALAESFCCEGFAGCVINGSAPAAQVGGNGSEHLPDYESDEDHPLNGQPRVFRHSEPLPAHASAAERLARAVLLGEPLLPGDQVAQVEPSNGAAPGDSDSSNSSSASDPYPRSSSEDAEGDDDADDNDSQGPPGPLPPTQGSSESGDGGGCATSGSPDPPPPSPGGRGGTIPVAADNARDRAPTWIDAHAEIVPALEGADLSEDRGTKRKSSDIADEQPSPPGEPLAGKQRRLTDESGSSELSAPCPPAESPSSPKPRPSRKHVSSQDSTEDQPADAGGSVVAASSKSSGTKRKASNVEDDDQEEEEFSHGDDDEEPLSPVPREWTLRRLSTELRGMGSRVVAKRRRFYSVVGLDHDMFYRLC